jgi:hypothetical protein
MASLVPAMVKGLQMLHALRSLSVGNYGNSVHTGTPAVTYPSNNTVYPEDLTSWPVLDVQPMPYHDAPVLIVNVTDVPRGHNAFLDTTLVHSVPHILLP